MKENHSIISLLSRLWKHVSRRRKIQLTGLVALMMLGTIAEVASLGMVLPFLGVLTAPETVFQHAWVQPIAREFGVEFPGQLLMPLAILFALAALLSGVTRLALLWAQTHMGNAIGNDLGSIAFRCALYQSYAVHAARNSSEVIALLMTKINTVVYFIVIPVLVLITSAFIVCTLIFFMVLLSPKLTLMTFCGFGVVYASVAYATKKHLARDSKRVTLGQNRIAQVVQEGLGGIRDVILEGLQETYFQIYRENDRRLRRALSNIAVYGGAPRPVVESLGLTLIAFIAYFLSGDEPGMHSVIPMIGTLALAAQRLLPLVQQGYAGWTSMLGGKDSLNDVLVLLEQSLPSYCNLPLPLPMNFNHQIVLKEIHFQYSTNGPWVLQGVDLKIPRGSRVGFIGVTGSGKSTLIDILMGLLNPTIGQLLIDDVIVEETNHRAWQAHIAHVPQTIFLADTTIAENIAFGVPPGSIDKNRLKAAARQAQISGLIESWRAGYDTPVGERGIRLSGGQRQRIGIARALYKQADVIVFDEATSALDTETEQAVMDSINGLGGDLTILIVAHRVTTLRGCDFIVELSGGVVKRIGNYKEFFECHL